MLKDGDTCPVCGQGPVEEKVINGRFKYKGKECIIPDYHIFACGICKEELVSHESLEGSEKTLTDFRRRIDGLLTSDEIRAIRKRLGKTQKEMAEMLEVGEKNFVRYENGQVTQSKGIEFTLRALDVCHDLPEMIKAAKAETGYKTTNIEIEALTWHGRAENDIKYSLTEEDYSSADAAAA